MRLLGVQDARMGYMCQAAAAIVSAAIGLESFGVRIAPVAQTVGTHHWHDSGSEAHADESAFDRVLLSPGIEVAKGRVSLYADVAFPVFQNVDGNQLVAQELFTLRMSYSF